MSIAWATVVLVVLLLPGFVFFWGFYAPNQVTRETVPASPLGQLAGVVIIGFFVHAAAYVVINSHLVCHRTGGIVGIVVPCVDFDQLAALLRIDGVVPPGKRPISLNDMLDANAGWVLAYFGWIAAVLFVAGLGVGKLVERGIIPLTRHRYLFMLEEGRKGDGRARSSKIAEARLVRAHVLSRTAHDDLVLIYDGVLRDFYSKADGTISYVVLRGARSGSVRITGDAPSRAGLTSPMDSSGTGDTSTALLVLTSEDIANVYFEHLSAVTQGPGEEEALDAAVQRLENAASDAPARTGPPTA
jgi:hypothetical protein